MYCRAICGRRLVVGQIDGARGQIRQSLNFGICRASVQQLGIRQASSSDRRADKPNDRAVNVGAERQDAVLSRPFNIDNQL